MIFALNSPVVSLLTKGMPQFSMPAVLATVACISLAKLQNFFRISVSTSSTIVGKEHLQALWLVADSVVKQASSMAVLLWLHKDTVQEVIQCSVLTER